MAEKYGYISETLIKRRDPFTYSLRYCSTVTGKDSIKDMLTSEGIEVKTLLDETPVIRFLRIPSQTLAAGLEIIDLNCVADIKDAVINGIPIILISQENCLVEFIKYEYTITDNKRELKCVCVCKLKKRNSEVTEVTEVECGTSKPHSCKNEYEFCKNVENKDSPLQKHIDRILTSGGITDQNEGLLPVYRYSQFIDFIIWRKYIGEKIEKVRIENIIKQERDNRNLLGS